MSVVAKFFVQQVNRHAATPDAAVVILSPVSRGEENKDWAKWTPSGKIEMTINNPRAVEAFVLGEEYLITFEVQPKPAPNEHGHVPGHS